MGDGTRTACEVQRLGKAVNDLLRRLAQAERKAELALQEAGLMRNAPDAGSGASGGSPVVLRVTTTAAARSGATYGTGLGVVQVDSGGALTDSTDPAMAGVSFKNLLDKTLVAGANNYVFCDVWGGAYWAVAPGGCGMVV